MSYLRIAVFIFSALVGAVGCVTGPRSFQSTEVVVQMGNMRYTPDIVRVKAGEPLMITFVNDDTVSHDFVIGDLADPVHLFVSPGRRIATSLFFSKPGEFQFICSQKGHTAAGMVGRIVVE